MIFKWWVVTLLIWLYRICEHIRIINFIKYYQNEDDNKAIMTKIIQSLLLPTNHCYSEILSAMYIFPILNATCIITTIIYKTPMTVVVLKHYSRNQKDNFCCIFLGRTFKTIFSTLDKL